MWLQRNWVNRETITPRCPGVRQCTLRPRFHRIPYICGRLGARCRAPRWIERCRCADERSAHRDSVEALIALTSIHLRAGELDDLQLQMLHTGARQRPPPDALAAAVPVSGRAQRACACHALPITSAHDSRIWSGEWLTNSLRSPVHRRRQARCCETNHRVGSPAYIASTSGRRRGRAFRR